MDLPWSSLRRSTGSFVYWMGCACAETWHSFHTDACASVRADIPVICKLSADRCWTEKPDSNCSCPLWFCYSCRSNDCKLYIRSGSFLLVADSIDCAHNRIHVPCGVTGAQNHTACNHQIIVLSKRFINSCCYFVDFMHRFIKMCNLMQ